MNKVAEIAPLATLRPMVIFAWDRPVVANLNQLILNFFVFLNLLSILIFENLNLALDALDAVLVIKSQLD